MTALEHAVVATFDLDYSTERGWWGEASTPAHFAASTNGVNADEACDRAYEHAASAFGEDVVVIYHYSSAGYAQARVEDQDNPDRLACDLCNPPALEDANRS
jgi:hypothetical protein